MPEMTLAQVSAINTILSASGANRPDLDHVRTVVVSGLGSRHSEIEEALYVHVEALVPYASCNDHLYDQGVRSTISELLVYGLAAIKHGSWPEQIPSSARKQARRAARARIRLSTVQRRYLAAHVRLGHFVREEVHRNGLSSHGEAVHQLEALRESVLEHLVASLETEYIDECELLAGSPQLRRGSIVRRLLSGGDVGSPEESSLDYDRHHLWHLAVIASMRGATNALYRVRDQVGANLLLVPWDDDMLLAWLGARRPIDVAKIHALLLEATQVGISLGIGELGWGAEGWHATHRQAREAFLVSSFGSGEVMRYADVAVIAPWLHDPGRARALVDLYLAPISDQKDGGLLYRQTLQAYFRASRNIKAAAVQLKVDRTTVQRRLREIERRMGYQLARRQAEIEIALRLKELLDLSEQALDEGNSRCTRLVGKLP